MKFKCGSAAWAMCGLFAAAAIAAEPGKLTVDASKPGAKISPLFYGLMTEEINHAYDGGLYAELIQNRIFQDAEKPVDWSVATTGSAAGTIAIDETDPVNDKALKRSLRLDITSAGPSDSAGVANSGFWGIPVWPNTKYHASFYAKAGNGFSGPLSVSIQSNDGKKQFAVATVGQLSDQWKKYEVDLATPEGAKSTDNQFVLSGYNKGSVWFSLVSLFPPTYHDRPNGNRIDIMEKLADLHPAFLRFPGGNFLEGDTIPTRFDWKKTIGPLEDRPGHMGCWGYHVSDGLGLLEFLNWCEDLKMEPLLAVYAGYSLKQQHVNPGPDLEPYVQEALQEIEYCTGDTTTEWGKRRAADGHPAPFVIHYVEIGNEDWFDHSNTYDGRFAQIFKAIKAKYPNLQCIATARKVHSVKPDLYDDHDYPSATNMLREVKKYDHYSDNEPKVFFGEWATQNGRPTPTMQAALCDAAWLTGLQRDSDKVLLNCYAPLFVNVNEGAWQWPTNLIGYDAANSFGSPSYYAQSMFSRNWGDTGLAVTVDPQKIELPAQIVPHGGVGVGTWHTAAEYKDIKVTQDGKTLYQSAFGNGLKGWKPSNGNWRVNDGALSQTDTSVTPHIIVGDSKWQDYTLQLKARKTGGAEGFLVLVHASDRNNFLWFNVGGWGNTASGIESIGGDTTAVGESSPFTVQTGRWYDIRVECRGDQIKCYVDNKLIVTGTESAAKLTQPVFAAASKVDSTGEVILKVVNVAGATERLAIDLQGAGSISKEATMEELQGNPDVQNTVDEPTKIAPVVRKIDDAGPQFVHDFPANSVTVIRLKP